MQPAPGPVGSFPPDTAHITQVDVSRSYRSLPRPLPACALCPPGLASAHCPARPRLVPTAPGRCTRAPCPLKHCMLLLGHPCHRPDATPVLVPPGTELGDSQPSRLRVPRNPTPPACARGTEGQPRLAAGPGGSWRQGEASFVVGPSGCRSELTRSPPARGWGSGRVAPGTFGALSSIWAESGS